MRSQKLLPKSDMDQLSTKDQKTTYDGVLIVDKPVRMTSHDVIWHLRRIIGRKKIGHAGTLDPFATGVLVILIGKATKLSAELVNDEKKYRATMVLGAETDTQDFTGKVTKRSDVPGDVIGRLKGVLPSFKGRIAQVPPMFSAKKIRGKRLYQMARKGMNVRREPVSVVIHHLEIDKASLPEVEFSVHCSKGTYIRTLCHDIGDALGCGAHLSSLRRTGSGQFSIDEAMTLTEIKKMAEEGTLAKAVLPVEHFRQ